MQLRHPIATLLTAVGLVGLGAFVAPLHAKSREPAGAALDLQQFRGKVVYLDFWASWCGPCKQSFPFMEQLSEEYPKKDFAVVLVNVDHDRARADSFIHQMGATLPVIYDPDGAIAARMHVKAMPTSMLIGRDGRIRFVHPGFFVGQQNTYQSQIQELLNER